MDNEVPLARQTGEGRSMLLAGSGSRPLRSDSIRGDTREKKDTPAKGAKGGAPRYYKEASKDDATAKVRDGKGRGGKKSRQDNPSRAKVGRLQKGPRRPGRSAEELGIEWYDHYCPERDSAPHSHWWVEVNRVDGGSIFACKFCIRIKWLPNTLQEGQELNKLMRIYGNVEGYHMVLDERPKAKKLVAKLQDLHYIRNAIEDKELRARVIVTLINAKDSDFPAVVDELTDWPEDKINLPEML